MGTVALIGFLGGLITGISPCILPVLPVVFFSGLNSNRVGTRDSSSAARPYLVIAGLVCSFSVVTLAGSALVSALHLPQDAIRWAALVVLTLIGLGLIFPPLQHLIEWPFARNAYKTWNNYQNLYWPAEYLIDANGTVRHIKFGEGDYDTGEKLIRQLLADALGANPDVRLPAATHSVDTTPQATLTPETYLGVDRAGNYGGDGEYKRGTATFGYPATLAYDKFALRGQWTLDDQGPTADSDDAAIRLNYTANDVYAVVGGTGTITVTRGGKTTTTPIGGPPTLHQIVGDNSGDTAHRDQLDMQVSKGLQVFSFTFG